MCFFHLWPFVLTKTSEAVPFNESLSGAVCRFTFTAYVYEWCINSCVLCSVQRGLCQRVRRNGAKSQWPSKEHHQRGATNRPRSKKAIAARPPVNEVNTLRFGTVCKVAVLNGLLAISSGNFTSHTPPFYSQ